MGKIIIDITELVHWRGKLAGVPRVMNELATRFDNSDTDTLFVEWDKQGHVFYSVRLSEVLETIEKDSTQHAVDDNPSPSHERLAKVVKKVEATLPAAKPLLKIPKRVARKLLVKPEAATNTDRAIVRPQKGDLLFVMCDWHDQPFVDEVAALQKEGVKLAIVAHDMLPLVTPQFSGHATERLKYFVSKLYPVSSVVFANSKSTRQDVQAWLKNHELSTPKIEVIRLGDDFRFAKPQRPPESIFNTGRLKRGNFILCVGTIEARKNHALLYYVYKLAHQRGIYLPDLVIVGRRGWRTEDIYGLMSEDPEVKDKFTFLHNAGDEELAWLYNHCLFSIYPSFYEGWGLPIAESLAHGIVCICSNTSSMPEIAGELINYFSPSSPDECLTAIQKLLDPQTLKAATNKVQYYQPATWDQTFDTVQKAIGEIHAQNN